jgi:hypothetical protein
MYTDVSEENIAFSFRLEEYAKKETSTQQRFCLQFALLLSPEDGGSFLLRNVRKTLLDYTAYRPKIHYS